MGTPTRIQNRLLGKSRVDAQEPATVADVDGATVDVGDGYQSPSFASRFWHRWERLILGTSAIAVVLASWQLFAGEHWVNTEFTSEPSAVATSLVNYFQHGTGWSDLWVTGQEFLLGFALSLAIGIPVGVLMGWYKKIDELLNPMVIFLNNIPRIALAPLFVIWFGIGLESKVAIVLCVATIPLIFNARAGVVTTERTLVQMARSYGTSNISLLWKVVLPGSVPTIVSGVRIAVGQGLQAVVLAEFIAAEHGLGFTLFNAANTLDTARMFDAVTVIAVAGLILTALATRLERYFDRWRVTD
jgi:ABC-type nitrate/sulfonate/bicarbonate transport system permease component